MALTEHSYESSLTEPGWYPDPDRVHEMRYYDGANWTGHVTHYGPTPCGGCFLFQPSSG